MDNILNPQQIQSFIADGFVRIDNAFSAELASEARTILWKDLPVDPIDNTTWTRPTIWLGMYTQEPFVKAANAPILHKAFDQLVGKGKWNPCMSMGSFPVRFPSAVDPGDTGWHVDASFPGANPTDYFSARINVRSKGRALLMLFLFSDVSERDAPTRILRGSHLDVARLLKPEGEAGLSFMELAAKLQELPKRKEVLATGKAGTVYLCHPFLVHAGQQHRGLQPKFMAQPPLLPKSDFSLEGVGPLSPVEEAIRIALDY
ncbi:phytanoyl-CoA dioxygenase family protein [Paradesertivirga mongoliensis]|uniref:Phytanoyl-CoA dioxygenase family protein n=1 Tax=Paradesertivirga mongoliensis TaxID=2100740 RepID=A0ABW4ZIU5_9SPHI|nr:phytanoyl-CoA dioxygenase family protein [Pedobacter mongoliensis]